MIFTLGEKKDCGIIVKSVANGKFQFVSAMYEHIKYADKSIIASGDALSDSMTGQVWVFLEPDCYSKVVFKMEIAPLLDSGDVDPSKSVETIYGEALVKM